MNAMATTEGYPDDYEGAAGFLSGYLTAAVVSDEESGILASAHFESISHQAWLQVACLLGLTTKKVEEIWQLETEPRG